MSMHFPSLIVDCRMYIAGAQYEAPKQQLVAGQARGKDHKHAHGLLVTKLYLRRL